MEDKDVLLVQDIIERKPTLKTYQDYYDGTCETKFLGADLEQKFGEALKDSVVNRIGPIIDLSLDRLNLEGWGDGDEASDDDQLADELWHDLELDVLQHRVHFDALVKGAGYILCWTDSEDNLIVGVQEPEQIALRWDSEDPDKIETAIKVWRTSTGHWRLNKYTDSTLEKYRSQNASLEPPTVSGAWEQYQDDEDHNWPLQHTFGMVPLFHFKVTNRSACYGNSDITPLIPLQAKLNQTLGYQTLATYQQSWRQRWITGVQPMVDPETKEAVTPFSAKADSIWAVASKDAEFGDFDEADLEMFEKVLEGDEARIARTARVPIHYVLQKGTPPSGEALKVSESMWVGKIVARQRMFGLVWTKIIKLAMHLKHGNELTQRFYPMWTSPESRDETNNLQRKTLLQSLVSQGKYATQALKELGYTNDQIEAFEELRIERQLEVMHRDHEGAYTNV